MKTRSNQKKCAEWPFGPRSGQESPTLGAKSTNQRPITSTPASSLASTFASKRVAHPRSFCQTSLLSTKAAGGNLRRVKQFRVDGAITLTSRPSFTGSGQSFILGQLPKTACAARQNFPHAHRVLSVVDRTNK